MASGLASLASASHGGIYFKGEYFRPPINTHFNFSYSEPANLLASYFSTSSIESSPKMCFVTNELHGKNEDVKPNVKSDKPKLLFDQISVYHVNKIKILNIGEILKFLPVA